jgi:phenylalanyl-tRNA synthetase beta chain
MYISYNWLKDFLKIPARVSVEEIADKLTSHTVEIEGLVKQADTFNNVVVGKVLDVQKHPNADRLRVTVVDIKTKQLNIVCGAPNVEAGQLVPVALIGAVLPNGLIIEETEIRGVLSQGMICAEDELGLGSNHEGIIVLNKNAKVGEKFAKYLQADDIIFEVDNKSLSNRPDLWGHYGIARELSAIFGWSLKPYGKLLGKLDLTIGRANKLEVKIDDKEVCPRYQALRISGIRVSESPAWLKNRLIAAHQRPINNIVDLTNYVMLECGQPLHAFDASRVEKIIVRRANKDEMIETLDEKERHLGVDNLVIASEKEAIAIAGVIGGKNSEVNSQTTKIILEAANFSAPVIRKSSQQLGLRSEASMRFEKSVDPLLTESAIIRFWGLLKSICPTAELDSPLIDIKSELSPEIIIDLDLSWLNNKIGQDIPAEQVNDSLERLGFKISRTSETVWQASVPSWRATKDVRTKEDLAEEVLRLQGYDNITSQLPEQTLNLPPQNMSRILERKIKHLLANKYALSETYNYSFVGEDQLKKLNIDFFKHLKLANPLSEMYTTLRQSLAPGLFNNVKLNQARVENLGFFELGSVFFNAPGNFCKEAEGEETIPYQEKRLGIALAGTDSDMFITLKGLVADFFQQADFVYDNLDFSVWENPAGWADNKLAAKVVLDGQEVGVIAQASKAVLNNLNLKKNIALVEINFDRLTEIYQVQPRREYKEAYKYPAVIRDLAFVVDEKILYNDIRQEILNFDRLINRVELFDVYSGERLEAGQKSLAFHISYQSEDKTLTAVEVDSMQSGLVDHLFQKFDAKLRNF